MEVARLKTIHDEKYKEWEARKTEFEAQAEVTDSAINAKRAAYFARDSNAIVDYCALVLSQSSYPTFFPQDFELDYDPSSRQLIVDYLLPPPDAFPKTKGVKWVGTRKVYEEQKLSEAARTKLYDDVVYQVVLRTAHELIEADTMGVIHAVVINGIVKSIDRGTGKEATACIVSLRVEAAEFEDINLDQVDPKACFKTLKGVGSSKLHGLSPIPPIMSISRTDSRFVAAYQVADGLDEGVNLASMGWEDFEQLIRELFEKEFATTGGEVRVTQASRDGGVDAIAFDPDPIRGGKIVIQAKRYTNTVGVSAVRDLYGTVMNEGATKGVLVTTSDYGPDSYSFAQGKPLVLLNGGNLLHMLQKHGHRAKIDIREAKKLAQQEIRGATEQPN
jgi:restriction system protein